MTYDPFFDRVKDHFQYLTEDFGFAIKSEKIYPHFDFADVIFHSERSSIRVAREKGCILVDISPAALPEYWYDLATILTFLTGDEIPVPYDTQDDADYETGIDHQLGYWAGILETHYPRIIPVASDEKFWTEFGSFLEERKKNWIEDMNRSN